MREYFWYDGGVDAAYPAVFADESRAYQAVSCGVLYLHCVERGRVADADRGSAAFFGLSEWRTVLVGAQRMPVDVADGGRDSSGCLFCSRHDRSWESRAAFAGGCGAAGDHPWDSKHHLHRGDYLGGF